ncbi:MAG: hypothetical protein AAB967_03415, partial [Patescibacteria group bacterium]
IAYLMAHLAVTGVKTYYAALFSIFIFSILVYYLLHLQNSGFVKYAILFFMIVFAAISLKPVLAFPFFVKNGVTIAAAREKFQAVAARYPQTDIFITASLWVLSENYEKMNFIGDITPEHRSRRPLVVVFDQKNGYGNWISSPTPPAEAEGCSLKENYFVAEIPRFLGMKLTNTMPGYGFAVYECE